MDELEISGKRYISSKRIAKENRYHADYIGQLIRAGRVAGTKVGRAWYVEEASFATYLGAENKVYASASAVQVAKVDVEQPIAVETAVPIFEKPKEESAVRVHIVEEEIPTSEVGTPTKSVGENIFVVPIKKTNLTYIADSSPLFPEISKRTKVFSTPAVSVPYTQEEVPVRVEVFQKKNNSKIKKTLSLFPFVAASALLFALAFYGSLGINSELVVEKGKPASVSLVGKNTFCFIFKTCQNEQ